MGREGERKGGSKEKWMSLESAWGNCGETAWINNKKKKEKKTQNNTN